MVTIDISFTTHPASATYSGKSGRDGSSARKGSDGVDLGAGGPLAQGCLSCSSPSNYLSPVQARTQELIGFVVMFRILSYSIVAPWK